MKIEVRFRAIDQSDALINHVARRVAFQLYRFTGAVSSVVVKVSDINGPKGGVDKRCKVTVRGPSLGAVRIEDRSGDAYSVVDMALWRAARTVGRELDRRRASRRVDGFLERAS